MNQLQAVAMNERQSLEEETVQLTRAGTVREGSGGPLDQAAPDRVAGAGSTGSKDCGVNYGGQQQKGLAHNFPNSRRVSEAPPTQLADRQGTRNQESKVAEATQNAVGECCSRIIDSTIHQDYSKKRGVHWIAVSRRYPNGISSDIAVV